MKKISARKKISEMLKYLIQKPPGAPVLVPESDKREEWHKAENNFDNIEGEMKIG